MKKTVTALILVSGLGMTGVSLAQGQGTSNVYFLDGTGSGAVAVWVDGQKVFANMFVDTPSMFPRQILAGRHSVEVTPFYAAPGAQDIAKATLDFRPGTYTLKVGNFASNRDLLGYGFKVPTLYMTVGGPN